jgi:hypothetical protein
MIMVFVRTCESTRLLALMLRNLGLKAMSISGQMSQVCYLTFTFSWLILCEVKCLVYFFPYPQLIVFYQSGQEVGCLEQV